MPVRISELPSNSPDYTAVLAVVHDGVTKKMSLGDVRDLCDGLNPVTGASATFVLADARRTTLRGHGSACTMEVPPDVFGAGARLDIIATGAGQVEITEGAGVSVLPHPEGTLKLFGQYSMATLVHLGSNVWVLGGHLEPA